MSRYSPTKVNRSSQFKNKKKEVMKYNTTIYDKTFELDDDMYIITQEGDRLDNLSMVFYGNSKYWWYIAHVNNITTINVEAGISLRIPSSVVNAKGK